MNQKITADDLRAMGIIPNENSVSKRAHDDVKYPRLGLKIYIVGNCFRGGIVEMFAKAGCKGAQTVEEADLIVYSGGEDVDPSLYGEKALGCTCFNAARDEREIDVFTKALALGKPQFGICRGMQFLHVMNGGKLYQDVSNHGWTHNIVDMDGKVIRASSMHHQMCIEDDTCFPLAYAENKGHGKTYQTFGKESQDPTHLDLEAAVYPNINAIAVQGHPEVGGYPEFTIWCLERIIEFLDEGKVYVMGSNREFEPPAFLKQRIETTSTEN